MVEADQLICKEVAWSFQVPQQHRALWQRSPRATHLQSHRGVQVCQSETGDDANRVMQSIFTPSWRSDAAGKVGDQTQRHHGPSAAREGCPRSVLGPAHHPGARLLHLMDAGLWWKAVAQARLGQWMRQEGSPGKSYVK